jgi:hypothetical protein
MRDTTALSCFEDELMAVLNDTSRLLPADPVAACARAEALLLEAPDHAVGTFQLASGLARRGLMAEAAPYFARALRADGRLAREGWQAALGAEPGGSLSWIGRFAEVSCPHCGASGGQPIWVGSLGAIHPEASQLDALRTWVRCAHCALVRVERPPTDAALEAWEQGLELPAAQPPDEDALHQALLEHEQLLLRLRADAPGLQGPGERPRLLEVGSGWGDRLAAAHWTGFDAVGVEPDAQRRAWGQARLGPLALQPSLEELDESAFDVVIFSGAIEEEDEGLAVLELLGASLVVGGLLCLRVSLLDHPIARLRGYDDPTWSRPNRRLYFERASLEACMQAAGLRLEARWADPRHAGSVWITARRVPG